MQCLADPDEVEEERERRPDGHRHHPEIRPADKREDRQHEEVRIAPRGDESEAAVDRLPDMDLDPEQPEEKSFLETSEDISADDDDEEQDLVRPRQPDGMEAGKPCGIP